MKIARDGTHIAIVPEFSNENLAMCRSQETGLHVMLIPDRSPQCSSMWSDPHPSGNKSSTSRITVARGFSPRKSVYRRTKMGETMMPRSDSLRFTIQIIPYREVKTGHLRPFKLWNIDQSCPTSPGRTSITRLSLQYYGHARSRGSEVFISDPRRP
jgi:hypothetical protein